MEKLRAKTLQKKGVDPLLMGNHIGIAFLPSIIKWYVIAFLGIQFMYFFARYCSDHADSSRFWQLINQIDVKSYSIYLFHVSLLYIVLFLHFKIELNINGFRVVLSFILGIIIPILLHNALTSNRILSYIFEVPYQKDS